MPRSRPIRWPTRIIAAFPVLLATLVLGCVSGSGSANNPIDTEAEAVARARAVTTLDESITVIGTVRRGVARDLYTGALASFIEGDRGARDQAARLARPAWRVDVSGQCLASCRPAGLWNQELIIDEKSGELLFMVETQGPLGR